MTESRQGHWISLALQDGVKDPEATESGDVVQDTMNLQIHLIECFLDVHDMLCSHLDQTSAMSPQRADRANETGGRKLDRSRPTECRYCNHWQSDTSVFRP